MQITLTGKQVDIGDRLRKHVEENVLATVTKYFNSPVSCEVTFSKEGGELFSAEVIVHPAKNIVLKGTGEAVDPYSAFDNANAHIATRLRRHKNKLNSHKGKPSFAELASEAIFHYDEEGEDDAVVDAPLTIAEVDANIPVCSVSEAVMYMDLNNEVAIMFRNVTNNVISMVYRRKDGNIGWIEPKN
ncbi:MAG: ribosome-associated translation inhibitor RaiA [Lactobacillaceae bacterium]|jgi:ribosomal subunit interface protein|nr:ribosome-associated translation inhibitor RaiA [Lactobacillaceae bacterium]